MARYPYTILPGEIGPIYKPLITVILSFKKTHKITPPITAVVDSGADVCFCAENIGLWLGIKLRKKRLYTFTAANRTLFQAVRENLILYIGRKRLTCPFFFTNVLPKETPIILGQMGFFDTLKVIFNAPNKIIEIIY